MNREIEAIREQIKDAFEGSPWFGKSVMDILNGTKEQTVFVQPKDQHSILELVWHMITWREFTIDRLQHSPQMKMDYFEENDWRALDHQDRTLWPQALERLKETQAQLLSLLGQRHDDVLDKTVAERTYNFRKLLLGIIQHDIYHLGQIAYIHKLLITDFTD